MRPSRGSAPCRQPPPVLGSRQALPSAPLQAGTNTQTGEQPSRGLRRAEQAPAALRGALADIPTAVGTRGLRRPAAALTTVSPFRADRGCHPRHRWDRDDDLRGRLPQPRRHRHSPGGGLGIHVRSLQGRRGERARWPSLAWLAGRFAGTLDGAGA